jgi:hypothetical protein
VNEAVLKAFIPNLAGRIINRFAESNLGSTESTLTRIFPSSVVKEGVSTVNFGSDGG